MKNLLIGLFILSSSSFAFANETFKESECINYKGTKEKFVLDAYYVSYDKIPEGASAYCQLDIKEKTKANNNCSEFTYEYNGEESFGYYTMPKEHLCEMK